MRPHNLRVSGLIGVPFSYSFARVAIAIFGVSCLIGRVRRVLEIQKKNLAYPSPLFDHFLFRPVLL